MEPSGATSTFVIRMWSERGAGAESWRGSIDDVVRKRRLFFTNLGAMCEFIAEQRRLDAPPVDEKEWLEE
jgi:hypothetical protein